jgi:hypothetical protein
MSPYTVVGHVGQQLHQRLDVGRAQTFWTDDLNVPSKVSVLLGADAAARVTKQP